MKAIDVNKKCASCKHETQQCVKMTDGNGIDICFDTNVIDVDGETFQFMDELKEERNKWRNRCVVLLISVVITAIVMAALF